MSNGSGPDEVEVQRAKQLALDLIATVRQAYEAHISGGPPPSATAAQPAPPMPPAGAPGYNAAPGAAPGSDPYAAYGGSQGYQQYCIDFVRWV